MAWVLINKTQLRSDDLRSLLVAGIRHLRAGKLVSLITVRQGRGFITGGWAWVDKGQVELVLPRGFDPEKKEDRIELAQVLEHELDHLRGAEHPTMPYWADLEVDWSRSKQLRWRKGRSLSSKQMKKQELEARIRKLFVRLSDVLAA